MVHFKRDAIRKSIETVTTHFRQLIARKSKNESKTTWSIVCPITLTQRLLTKTATTYFRRLIARGAKINALRLCTMCTGKFAGRPINRKYIFIYILSTPRNIWRYSTIYNANISWRCNAQCAPSAVHRLSCTEKFFPPCIDGVGEAKWILRNFFAIAQTTNDAFAKYWYFLFVWQCRRTFLWKMNYQPKSWHQVCVSAWNIGAPILSEAAMEILRRRN